uniref:Secreted protein n=1 Tax=Anguilla anguilla TaxID=7936 RepID=A0A0E9XLW9_ANGAN
MLSWAVSLCLFDMLIFSRSPAIRRSLTSAQACVCARVCITSLCHFCLAVCFASLIQMRCVCRRQAGCCTFLLRCW